MPAMKKLLYIAISLAFVVTSQPSSTDEMDVMYGSIRQNEANVRSGPGTQYPILWIYKKFGYPVEILRKYQSWYQIRDIEGETGWVYKSLISKRRTTLVSEGKPIVMYREPDATEPLVKFAPGVILAIDHCTQYLCKVVYGNSSGWVIKKRLEMGVY
jgi:SH3-like domain-containing protein